MTPGPVDPSSLSWVEAGVSGLARSRDWDVVQLAELPELADLPLEEARFGALADGTLVASRGAIPSRALELLAARLGDAVRPPYEAIAARKTRLEWTVAARELKIAEVELGALEADELVVAVAPDGSRSVLVDGIEAEHASGALEAAVSELTELAGRRYATFVVRARRTVGDRFALSVDPL